MARPVPVNQVGMRYAQQYDAQAYVPAWPIARPAPALARARPRGAPARLPGAVVQASWRPKGVALLAASFLAGGLAVASGLGLRDPFVASSIGLDERGSFFLLAAGVYLLATTLYAAWRTQLLKDLSVAPQDVRLMAFASMAIGGLVTAAVLIVALTIAIVILLLLRGVFAPPAEER